MLKFYLIFPVFARMLCNNADGQVTELTQTANQDGYYFLAKCGFRKDSTIQAQESCRFSLPVQQILWLSVNQAEATKHGVFSLT